MPHKLLLADDSVTIQRVIELTFADQDVQVAVVGNGRQAIERIAADRPDIVLADIGMPERDGYEVAAFVKNTPRLSHIPVVLLTGAFEPIDETRARTIGCEAVLVKPFEPQAVINRVRELLAASAAAGRHEPPPENAAGSAQAGVATAAPGERVAGDALEDYFDRLDAAFARLAGTPRAAAADSERTPSTSEELNLPSTQRSSDAESPRTIWNPAVSGEIGPSVRVQLATAFAALLAVEQGRTVPPVVPPPAAVSEATIEEIVRRVLARLADDTMRALVLDTTERLVREEIERIKRA